MTQRFLHGDALDHFSITCSKSFSGMGEFITAAVNTLVS